MAYENFNSWTETDPHSRITINGDNSVSGNPNNPWDGLFCGLVGDYGAGHFGAFKHQFAGDSYDWSSSVNGETVIYALANTSSPNQGNLDSANVGLAIIFQLLVSPSNKTKITLKNFDGDSSDFNDSDFTWDGVGNVWTEFERTGSTVTLKLYSNSGRTTLVDTLSVTYTSTTLRYAATMCNQDGNTGSGGIGTNIENLEFIASGTDANVTPSAQALTLTLQTPSVTVSSSVSPSQQALTATLQTPSKTVSSSVSPAAQTLTLTLQTSTRTGSASPAPSAQTLTLAIQAPSVTVSSSVSPSELALTGTVQTPTTTGGGIDLSADCILHLKMNEAEWNGTSGEVIDSSGHGNHGTAVNGATTIAGGKISRGGQFNLSTSRNISLANDGSLTVATNSISGLFWIKPTATDLGSGWHAFLGSNNVGGLAFGLVADGRPKLTKVNSVDAPVCTQYAVQDQWALIGFTFDSVLTTNNLKYYIDGVLINTVSFNQDFTAGAQSSFIGKRYSSDGYFNGVMDDVMLFDRVLTADEITALYNGGVGSESLVIPEHDTASPSALSVAMSLQTPSVVIDAPISPSAQALTLTLQSPSVTTGSNANVTPAALSLTASLQSITKRGDASLSVGAQAITASLNTPTVSLSANVAVSVFAMSLTLNGGTAVNFIGTIVSQQLGSRERLAQALGNNERLSQLLGVVR